MEDSNRFSESKATQVSKFFLVESQNCQRHGYIISNYREGEKDLYLGANINLSFQFVIQGNNCLVYC
jgi:hypothetical protein